MVIQDLFGRKVILLVKKLGHDVRERYHCQLENGRLQYASLKNTDIPFRSGIQYASSRFTDLLNGYRDVAWSMSRKGIGQ